MKSEADKMINSTSMDPLTTNVAALFIESARYYLATVYWTKLRCSVEALPREVLWLRANEQSNSVANLVLHLEGNIRHWILCGVGGAPSLPDRASEFLARNGPDADELLAKFEGTLAEVDQFLGRLTAADLIEARFIQGREVTVLEAVFHVVEHFSFHLGQIVMMAKIHAPGAIRFYADDGAFVRPLEELGTTSVRRSKRFQVMRLRVGAWTSSVLTGSMTGR